MNKVLEKIIKNNQDIIYFSLSFKQAKCDCIYYRINADIKYIESSLIPKIETHLLSNKSLDNINLITLKEIDLSKLENYLYSGNFIVFYSNKIYTISSENNPKRSAETSPSELTISGSKDGFIEDINTNISLIRKRIKSSCYKIEYFEIGRVSKTKLALTYIDNIIDEEVLKRIKVKLNSIDVEYLFNAGHLQSLINDDKLTLFPSLNYTSRADFCYESLLTGRFAIFIDNIPLAMIAPINFSFFSDFTDASNDHYLVALFDRIIQYIALFIGVFFLGFITAILTYHTELLPYLFLADFISARKGVSVSIVTELFLADLFFQIFRVAGTKSLSGINQALLIMGSIIISQIAVSSGIISQEIVLFSALTTISPFLVSNNIGFNNALNLLKIFIFICSGLFGLLGFSISSIIVVIYLANLDSFGVAFGNIFNIFNPKKFKSVFLSKSFNKINRTTKHTKKRDN
ncbi:MAG: spore germination protein [Bacilli bacterium]|nr:spore germination protein [Bacilli bacterium]